MFVSGKDSQPLDINLTPARCFLPLWLTSSTLLAIHVEIRPRVNLHLLCAYLPTYMCVHLLCNLTSPVLLQGRHACQSLA
ncbi:hypothetical protein COCC4DRAFT_30077 [Bipolaris maydis ATCC 48331]|uniref:Uncharacterized protein n=2 Tax=Cochliobolus heterostrophus TaxID=5016 RepID=M2TVL5_COCH5|nr:uncharacterized protein COCC4DRAFT_30077 [Bipolaris maydis ATCC 48331]EMD90584.1 hypothetical protein COCHEDRAFT_1022430 [Bipolaris maydis C5]ENI09206.1 hypothetical protein COCC4DRAFT_30077 [Bipolaris maydis ATCC 48331]